MESTIIGNNTNQYLAIVYDEIPIQTIAIRSLSHLYVEYCNRTQPICALY